MRYYNIKNHSQQVSFREAVCQGISSDMGLFMPVQFPDLNSAFLKSLPRMTFQEIAFEVGSQYIGNEIPAGILRDICEKAFNFPIILRQIEEKKYSLELFHGPTAAFKDYGARFMSQCFRYFTETENRKTVVLVATSGDTGSAIANSFLSIDGIEVVILYPSGKVSDLQEKQLTTLGQNITALEIEGTFDECQAMVKQAFAKFNTRGRINLTSANSINIARLIPQSFYYYYAAGQLNNRPFVVSVPSGNFGNITGAMFAWKTGLPVKRFIASTNINKVVPDYLKSGSYNPLKSVQTIANAMDVGNPSNFERIMELFEGDWNKINSMVSGYWFSDESIREHIKEEYTRSGYILDPHGAIGSMGLDSFLEENPDLPGIFVETAHPAKFTEVVEPLINASIELPDTLKECLTKEKASVKMMADYKYLEAFLAEQSF